MSTQANARAAQQEFRLFHQLQLGPDQSAAMCALALDGRGRSQGTTVTIADGKTSR